MSLTKVSYSMINGAVININDYGAIGDWNGTTGTDNTAAIQAAIDALAQGGTLFIPVGYYKFSSVSTTKAICIRGQGFTNNKQSVYGSSDWTDLANFGGSVLISTAASGDAISMGAQPVLHNFQLSDFMLVGPGSGTATGIHLNYGVGTYVENVFVGNFTTGWNIENSQDATYNKIVGKGNKTGLILQGAAITSNQTVFINPEFQRYEVFGMNIAAAAMVQILGGLFQDAVSGIALAIGVNSSYAAIKGVWFENSSDAVALDINGTGAVIENCYFANRLTDNINVRATAIQTRLLHNHLASGTAPAPSIDIDTGALSTFVYDSTPSANGTFTDFGTGTIYVDLLSNSFNQLVGSRSVNGTDTIGGVPTAAGTAQKITRKVTGMIDAAPKLNALAVEIPNSDQSCVVKLTALGSLGAGGAVGADEASQSVSCDIVITRTTGTNIAVTQSAYYGSAASNVAGATTCTTTVDTTLVVGAIGATQIVFIRPTVTKGGGGSDNHTAVMLAELVNSNTAGAHIYKN
jgi:hypothetical protein